jgi:hypothetical protein
MASHASVQFGEEAEKPLHVQTSRKIGEGTTVLSPGMFGVRSTPLVPRTDDTVPYCARPSLLIR